MTSLVNELREYLSRTHAYAWALATAAGKTPDEPAIVHAFLSDEMWPVLQGILRGKVVSNTQVVVRGIFTHQTPYVREVGAPRACEIADLMLVRMHLPSNPRQQASGKALLLQAKHKPKPTTEPLTDAGDVAQLQLYRDWNKFHGTSRLPTAPSDGMHSTAWNFQDPHGAYWRQTSQYLTVVKGEVYTLDDPTTPASCGVSSGPDHARLNTHHWPNGSPWTNGAILSTATAAAGVDCLDDFAATLHDFVMSMVGRNFDVGLVGATNHWSIFVAEMLEIAGMKNYKFGKKKLTRSNALSAFSTVLPMIAAQEAGDFVASNAASGFDFSNAVLDLHRRVFLANRDGQAPPFADIESPYSPGHVPILLILTHGDELVMG